MDNTHFYILSQIIAFLGIVLSIVAFQQKKKTQILNFTIVSSLLYGIHYIFLNAWSGVANNMISVVRDCYVRRFGKKLHGIIPLLIFISAYVVLTIVTFDSWRSLLPLCAEIFYTIGVYYCNEQRLRIVKIVSCLLWLAFNSLVFSVIGIASDLLVIAFTLFAYIRYEKKDHKKTSRRRD